MYETKTFTVERKPYLCVEMDNNNDMGFINVKFLKHDTDDCFNITVPYMDKFNPDKWDFICIKDKNLDKNYEYFVFTAGSGFVNSFVIVDIINKKFSVSRIDELRGIYNISINIMDIDPLIIGTRIEYYDKHGTPVNLFVDERIENFLNTFEFKSYRFRKYPKSTVEYYYCTKPGIDEIEDGFENPYNKDLDHNKNRKEDKIMPAKKNETKATTTATEIVPSADKNESTPREIISQYAEAYDNMTKDAIRGNEVFGLLSPEHRLSIAAHLDQIVEILEGYIK